MRQRKASEGSSTETERSSAFWHGRMEVIRLCRGAILGFLAMHWITCCTGACFLSDKHAACGINTRTRWIGVQGARRPVDGRGSPSAAEAGRRRGAREGKGRGGRQRGPAYDTRCCFIQPGTGSCCVRPPSRCSRAATSPSASTATRSSRSASCRGAFEASALLALVAAV